MDIQEYSPIGKVVARGGQTIIVGVSIDNSYFKTENLERLILWSSGLAQSVFIMIPDEPAEHTYRAIGKTADKARSVARAKSNLLENKCLGIIEQNEVKNTQVIRWKNITPSDVYQKTLADIRRSYSEDEQFAQELQATTSDVLKGRGIVHPSPDEITIGIEFLFQELAFITHANDILEVGKTAYVYHKTMHVLRECIAGGYVFKADPNIGFITAE